MTLMAMAVIPAQTWAQEDPGGFIQVTLEDRVFTLHPSRSVASIRLPADEFMRWNEGYPSGFGSKEDTNALSSAIYRVFKDDFDFIFFISNNEDKPENLWYYGQLTSVKNDIEGIGMEMFDATGEVGSSGRLQAFIHLPYLTAFQYGPTLHEIVHKWANFIHDFEIATPDGPVSSIPHWGWAGVPGQLGGFDPETLRDLGDGLWQANTGMPGATSFGGNANGGNGVPYATWELYLMGLLPLERLDDIVYFTDVATDYDLVMEGKFSGVRMTYTVEQYIEDYGVRNPTSESSQKLFRALCVVLTPEKLSDEEWNIVSEQVEWFTRTDDDGIPYLYTFHEATRGLATMQADGLYSSLLKIE